LLGDEQERLRNAADTLIFSQEPLDDEGEDALADSERLCRALIDSGRWHEVTALGLADDVAACGPGRAGELKAA
jgi:hypothetical protein